MKTSKPYSILLLLTLSLSLTNCVQDGGYTVPNITVEEPDITPNSSIKAIKTALQQEYNSNDKLIYTFFKNENNPTYVEGYVVSSDAAGNFYKKLIIQDKIENPTAGIEIILNKTSLSETYDIGRKVYILLDGLSVSYNDGGNDSNSNPNDDIDPTNDTPGKYTLGILDGNQVTHIPSTSIKNHIFRSAIVAQIIPTEVNIDNIRGEHINTLIKIPSVQILKSDLTKTFAGEPHDEFDGFRTIFECNSENTIKLQTSTFSSFKSNIVPNGKGNFTGILSKDFRASFLVTILNTPSDIDFTNIDRCDPAVLECTGDNLGGNITLFEEDFENINSNNDLTASGWTNINVNGGDNLYSSASFRGNRYVQISAFRSEEFPLEAWLISPEINLDSTINEELTFETNTGYDNGKALTVFISSDYSGDVSTATWIRLDAVLSEGPSSGYGSFLSSGSINISCLSGKVHLAFKYLGADGGVTTTFQIDNVKVTGK